MRPAARTGLDPDGTLAAYAMHLGVPVVDGLPDDYPMWNGTALKHPAGAEDWAHEIAHWLLADPGRHRFVNYGWGHDFQFMYRCLRDLEVDGHPNLPALADLPWPTETDTPSTQEELDACILGCAFLARLGVAAPYDMYGFYDYHREVPEGGVIAEKSRTLCVETYRIRRRVQPWVAGFDAWLGVAPVVTEGTQ